MFGYTNWHALQDDVTALHIAVHNGHVEAVEMLTHKMNKEDINARDNVYANIIYYYLHIIIILWLRGY